ncbi:hypothetical protein DEU29_11177 [Idiomarina aquatica]|uniref:Uncharacterized protein n=1 Tax=Idiomarina aquatica TaxID=1327752 RepID=A0A4R6P3J4_9GAMM|nr:hypothetical protein [Idiomarina aquatica]TDP32137.1 hypothetical protein DEU29_11177 [Idiomarina aquatica]
MGSTGSGSFTDYSGTPPSESGNGMAGGASGTDRCLQAFTVGLEEVAQSEYYDKLRRLPNKGETLKILLDGRLFAVNEQGMKVGALPTSHNYLAGCLKDGFTYSGIITMATEQPVPRVSADFVADDA